MALHKGHFLICGKTRSGKGQLIRGIIDGYRKAGVPVLLYTSKKIEYLEVKNMVDFATMDGDLFCEKLKAAAESGKYQRGIIAMIDEAGKLFKNNAAEMDEIVNQFAAYGVEVYIVVQRAKGMVPPLIRNACDNAICFRQQPDDADYIAEQFGEEFSGASKLMPGEYIGRMGGFGEVLRGRSFDEINGKFQRV